MPAGEPHTMLSPIEKALLASCDQWRTVTEIQERLFEQFQFDRIPPTIAFLRRRRLIEMFRASDRDLDPAGTVYRQTGLGVLVLQAQLRKEQTADFTPERRLHCV
jgi:hypothetical protein